jgi:hypothetical protein
MKIKKEDPQILQFKNKRNRKKMCKDMSQAALINTVSPNMSG